MFKKNIGFIFVGGLTPRFRQKEAQSRSKLPLQLAAENFQWAFIEGVESNIKKSINLISAPFFPSYPKHHHDFYVQGFNFSHKNDSFDVSVGYLNLPGVKNIFKLVGLTRWILKISFKTKKNIVFVYSANLAYVAAALCAKLIGKGIKLCVIVTDLPEHPGDCSLAYRAYLKYIDGAIFYKLIKYVDGFVVLTEHMPDAMSVSIRKCVIVEGLVELSSAATKKKSIANHNDKKVVLYTGTLDKRYGAQRLVEAFNNIKSNDFELWVCGGGNAADDIEKASHKDKRIKYLGLKPRDEILKMQSQCDLLINPRTNDGDYNKYSFPSKLMEYMASGTPVLAYRLEGIPNEYYNYIYTVRCEDGEELSEAIIRVLSYSKTELCDIGLSAQKFILNEKNSKVQTRKVLEFIASI